MQIVILDSKKMSAKLRTVICLMRNDLRYHDNEILKWGYQNADYVIPLYCFDPRHYKGTWHFEFPKTGPFRLKFLIESVADLRKTLKEVGGGLLVRQGKPEVIVPQLIEQLGKDNVVAVAMQEEVTKEELDVENALQKNSPVSIKKFWGSSLYHKQDIPFRIRDVPNVFTAFRKQVESQSRVRPVINMPDKFKPLPPGVEEGAIPTVADLGVTEEAPDSRSAFPFEGGETTGLERIQQYFWEKNYVAKYKETRNGLIGAEYSTKFSTWLAHGCLSPRKIYSEVKKYEREREANQSTYWVIFELIWRDYFKFVAMKFGNKLFYLTGLLGVYKEWSQNKVKFDAWREGKTGVPFVDANMREMRATGFMSNRGRQNVASFLTKDLKLDWRLGAEWFEYLLMDHDVCSNYGNWCYSAGVGNDPRQDRKFNMIKQGLDYDPQGDYIRLWVPELRGIHDGSIHTPWTLSKNALERADIELGRTYPYPIVQAPEWSRHQGRGGSSKRGRGGGRQEPRGKQRGIDFYFSNPGQKRGGDFY